MFFFSQKKCFPDKFYVNCEDTLTCKWDILEDFCRWSLHRLSDVFVRSVLSFIPSQFSDP